VVLVGRSWFRMTSGDDEGTPVPLSPTKTARIGIDRRRLGLERRMSQERRTSIAPIALAPPTEAQPVEWDADAELPRRTVTISWWLVGVVGAVLMASGAAAAAMFKLRAAPAPAPVLSAAPVAPAAPAISPVPPAPPAPVIVEPLATPPPPSPPRPVAAAAAVPAPAVRPAPVARTARPTATATAPARRAPLSSPKRPVETAARTPATSRSKVWVDPFAE